MLPALLPVARIPVATSVLTNRIGTHRELKCACSEGQNLSWSTSKCKQCAKNTVKYTIVADTAGHTQTRPDIHLQHTPSIEGWGGLLFLRFGEQQPPSVFFPPPLLLSKNNPRPPPLPCCCPPPPGPSPIPPRGGGHCCSPNPRTTTPLWRGWRGWLFPDFGEQQPPPALLSSPLCCCSQEQPRRPPQTGWGGVVVRQISRCFCLRGHLPKWPQSDGKHHQWKTILRNIATTTAAETLALIAICQVL